jgi:hypothetical protein
MSRHVAPNNYKEFQWLSNDVGGSTQHERDMKAQEDRSTSPPARFSCMIQK